VTTKPEQRAISYLLGDLPESERVSFEREFFSNPALFEDLVQTETALVDDYVRRRLSPRLRKRFEEYYLAHPSRRERADFATARAAKIDGTQSRGSARQTDRRGSPWPGVFSALGRRWVLRVSMAAIVLILLLATGLRFVHISRLRRDLAQTQMSKQAAEQRERELQRQLSTERTQAAESTKELQRLRTAPPGTADSQVAGPEVVSLFLSVRSVRGADTGRIPTLVIPPGTRQVRVEVALGQEDYPSYRAALKPTAGPEVFARQHINPQRTKSGASLELTVPADRLAAGEYLFAVSGESAVRELDDIGRCLFRVEKKRRPDGTIRRAPK
jgi:hypothetical protein